MKHKNFYIRLRIYHKTTNRAGRTYPNLILKNMAALHKNVMAIPEYSNRDYTRERIKTKYFTPENLKHIGPNYAKLIALVTQYFECRAVWDRKIYHGTTHVVNTFRTYGYWQDVMLAHHYIAKIINGLDTMRFNIQLTRYKRKRSGKPIKSIKFKGLNSKQVATMYHKDTIAKLELLFESMINERKFHKDHKAKIDSIYNHIMIKQKLDFKAYNFKDIDNPPISSAIARPGKFQNKRIIIFNAKNIYQ